MFPNLKWLRLTPDRPGRGGQKTGVHSFQQAPVNDTRTLSNGHVYRGYWRREFDSVQYPTPQTFDPTATNGINTIHGYVYPSLTNPSAQPSITVVGQTLGPGFSHFWDFTHGTIRSLRPTAGTQAAVFRNINQRCFGGDGLDEALIMDDRTPAIHAQPNQPLGIGTPSQPLSLNSAGNITASGTGYVHNTGGFPNPYLNHPDPNNQLGTCITGDTITVAFPDPNFPGDSGGLPGPAVLTANAVTSNTTTFTATGTVSITSGQSLLTLAGATWPANFQYAGLAINFNGYSFVVLTHGPDAGAFDINGNVANSGAGLTNIQLEILGVYDGPTILAPGVPYTITGCQAVLPGGSSGGSQINAGVLGYSQSTNAKLVQVTVQCTRANGYFRNLGNISLGVPAADSSISGGDILTITDAFMKDGKKNVASASLPFTVGDVGSPFFIDRAGYAGAVLSSVVDGFIDDGHVRLADANQSGMDLGPGINAWWGADPIISDGTIVVPGFPNDLTSVSNPFVTGDVGKTIVVEGAGPPSGGDPTSLITTIASYVGPGHVTLTAAATTGVTTARCWWRGISVDTHSGPTYAYAWYDPETGHSSNISPLFQVPRPSNIGAFTDFANITPYFRIDPGYISYPDGASQTTPTGDGVRFSHILFFRTLSTPGSSTLYPIGSLMPFVGKVHPGLASTRGSWGPNTYGGWAGLPNNYVNAPTTTGANYWYDFSTDSDLLLSGGFRAPQFTNEKPMALLRGGLTQPGKPAHMEYWDRRTWLVNTQEPDKIVFSCDEAQCPLGVPEESFPPTNFLRLPAVDGRVIGMRTVGDMLIITTERWAYVVAGNNESNYRLMKVSSSMPGVGTYQMDEFPTYSGTEGEPTTLFYLGRDRIVYQWTVGAQAIPISLPVQNILDTAFNQLPANQLIVYQGMRVHCLSAWGRRLVVVSLNTSPSQLLIYDIDNQIWSTSGVQDAGPIAVSGVVAFTTVYGLNIPVNEVIAFGSVNAGHVLVKSWIRDDTAASSQLFTMSTFPMNFDGKKTRKQVVSVNLHATSASYRLVTQVDESSAASNIHSATFIPYTDPLDSIYGPAPVVPVDGSTVTDSVVLAGGFGGFPTDNVPIVGYRFVFTVVANDFIPGNIYALDIGYVDVEDPGDGDA